MKRSRAKWEQQTFGEKLIQEDRPRIAGDWLMIIDQMKRACRTSKLLLNTRETLLRDNDTWQLWHLTSAAYPTNSNRDTIPSPLNRPLHSARIYSKTHHPLHLKWVPIKTPRDRKPAPKPDKGQNIKRNCHLLNEKKRVTSEVSYFWRRRRVDWCNTLVDLGWCACSFFLYDFS